MAVIARAVKKLIAAGSNDPYIIPIGVILHVAVNEGKSLFSFFRYRSGGIESHFYIRRDGTIEQYRDTNREADANRFANSFLSGGKRYGFISIETQGMGPGEWTDAQIESIKWLTAELAKIHDFPLRKCPGPYSAGVGYHTMWGSPSAWTPVAKSCPGPERVKQFFNVLVPWMKSYHAPTDKMDPRAYFVGAHGAHVTWLSERLIAHGCNKRHLPGRKYKAGPTFNTLDVQNVRDFQHKQGWSGADADGLPGPETLRRLAAAPKK